MDKQKHVPVIVLLDKQVSGERTEIREWFENSRFATCEATNVFEALEQLSDFTIETRPDVVLLNVDCCDDEMSMVENMSDVPVVAFPHGGRPGATGKYFNANIGKMVSRLNELIPYH
jgi:hypothetical protein